MDVPWMFKHESYMQQLVANKLYAINAADELGYPTIQTKCKIANTVSIGIVYDNK